jgi:hypothetical protein
MTWTVHTGDCRDVLAQMREASVDTIICDPPYGLAFMGKAWDQQVPGPDYWRAALRVAKPGALLLAFGGTRTFHRLACAIEDAGWEVRDCLSWLYGSGFPKSLDIAKAIDKARAEDIEPIRVVCRAIRAAMDARDLKSRDLVQHFGDCNPRLIDHWAARDTDSQPSLPTWDQWTKLREVLSIDDSALEAEVWRLNGRKGKPGDAYAAREVVGEKYTKDLSTQRPVAANADDVVRSESRRIDVTAPATDAAKRWQGWGTALKPAWEPIILAMKPLDGTFAENAQRHGVAGLAIDAGRVGNGPSPSAAMRERGVVPQRNDETAPYHTSTTWAERRPGESLGRWPANVLLDDVAAAALDEQSGERPAGGSVTGAEPSRLNLNAYGERERVAFAGHGDGGGASRFFYVAKAARAERGVGNDHPTVKPVDLMRYLCRLTRTPTGGVVLDPFCGSGSTGVGAMLDGRDFIGVELDPHNAEIARRRVAEADPIGAQQSLFA